jgi:predicted GTPase
MRRNQQVATRLIEYYRQPTFLTRPYEMTKGRRLKLFYATQPRNGGFQSAEGLLGRAPSNKPQNDLAPPDFVLFVNNPRLISDPYRRYLEARIREAEPYPGLPIILALRTHAGDVDRR